MTLRVQNAFLKLLLPDFDCRARWNPKPGPHHRCYADELPMELWHEIFRFSTYIPNSISISPLDPFTPDTPHGNALAFNTPILSMQTKCKLVLVSKSWRRIANQLLYEHLVVSSPRKAAMVLASLVRSATNDGGGPGYGRFTKHIQIYTHSRGSDTIAFLQNIFNIFRECPNLKILSGTWHHNLPPAFMQAMIQLYGPSLLGLSWDNHWTRRFSDTNPFEFFSSFTSLQVLDLRHFDYEPSSSQLPLSRPLLPDVHELIISSNEDCVNIVATFRMPKLSRLTIISTKETINQHQTLRSFLVKHGQSLTYLNLVPMLPEDSTSYCVPLSIFLRPDLCPRLESFSFHIGSQPLVDVEEPHPTLRCIAIQGIKGQYLHPDPPTELVLWPGAVSTKEHLSSFTKEKFPALEIIRTPGFVLDSDLDGPVKGTPMQARDLVFWWTDHFAKDDIMFVDGAGTMWLLEDEEEPPTITTVPGAITVLKRETGSGSVFPPAVQVELRNTLKNLYK